MISRRGATMQVLGVEMKNILRIITLSRPLFKSIAGLSLIVLLMSGLQQAQPFLIKAIVDIIQKQITLSDGNLSQIWNLLIWMLGINLLASVMNSLSMRYGDYISSRMRKYLTEVFYDKVLTLPQRYFDSEVSGKILNQLNRGIVAIQDFLGMSTNFVLPAFFQSIFTIAILTFYSPLIGMMALAVFPMYILISHYSTKRWGAEEVKKNRWEDQSRGRIQEVIGNIRLVRSFMAQLREWQLVSGWLKKINVIYDRQSTTYHILNFTREFGLEIAFIGISLVVFEQTFRGTMGLGEMVLILQLMSLLRRPLHAMSFILERIQYAESGSKEFFEVMNLTAEEEPLKTKVEPVLKNPGIKFDKVSFKYEDKGEVVLRDVSFEIKPKETIALVGHSGAGKSTIINLILKFYAPNSGEIYLAGNPYRKLRHNQVRSQISLVFQDNELFSTTVRENVAYGKDEATDEEVVEALKQANAWDFVSKLPKGLNAEIGERGVKLSGGQKQRIQIARAMLHNRPILILDEATSSLDSKSESLIQQALEKLMKNKLVIIIAHRFSTIQNADQIIVVDEGTIQDSGKPEELVKRGGVYADLLRYQIEGNQKLLAKYDLK